MVACRVLRPASYRRVWSFGRIHFSRVLPEPQCDGAKRLHTFVLWFILMGLEELWYLCMSNKYIHSDSKPCHPDWICGKLEDTSSLECRKCSILMKGPATEAYFKIKDKLKDKERSLVPNGECPWTSKERPNCPFYE